MLGLRDPAELNDLDPYALGFYRANFMLKLERESKLASIEGMKEIRGLF